MSLVSQLNNKTSKVMLFFNEFKNETGFKECLETLQSRSLPAPLSFEPPNKLVTSSYLGYMADFMFRYFLVGEEFDITKTIAFNDGFVPQDHRNKLAGNKTTIKTLENIILAAPGKFRNIVFSEINNDFNAVFMFTAFAVLEAFHRSGRLPGVMIETITNSLISCGLYDEIIEEAYYDPEKDEMIECQPRKKYVMSSRINNVIMYLLRDNFVERATIESYYDFYYNTLGGNEFARELLLTIRNIVNSTNTNLNDVRMLVQNSALKNLLAVGGADFDAILKKNNEIILTDVKAIGRPLSEKDLMQLLGYVLLLHPEDSPEEVTHAGIYYPRTGDFLYEDINKLIKLTLPKFKTVNSARNKFITLCKKIVYKK
ncbi:hypothetical protein GL267_000290 [Acidithiobacillus ferrianus]|uniref:Uncharacterized protein n=2 Tax=Acidithiobacillus ferrianus TaxID=2678518 RepID=A0A845U6K1_9PROT|nr:hypothetical protein [Acidithiobacillus ferrianus]NDU41387.1 hypothetical protein [Acidithiobacillus ferrianus]